ncbi:hypothetical protein LguiB_026504 [Lonicera macranthoides]
MSEIHEEEDAVCMTIWRNLNEISRIPSISSVFKVHHGLRRVNERAYNPDVIAIGPYHHGHENLKMMQDFKLHYLVSLLKRENRHIGTFVDALRPLERRIRRSYAQALPPDPDQLIEMMVVDGIFVIELLGRFSNPLLRDPTDLIFNMEWMLTSLQRDLLLFENQIPLFVICELFGIIKGEEHDHRDLLNLVMKFFLPILPGRGERGWEVKNLGTAYNHLLGLVSHQWLPATTKLKQNPDGDAYLSVLEERGGWEFISCATTLVEAGIKFKKGDGTLFDVTLVNKTLIIPPLIITCTTESVLRNLIAYEQYDQQSECFNFVTDYVKLMDCLIDSPKDVEILRHVGILVNCTGSDEGVSDMFNNICDSVVRLKKKFFFYAEVFNGVNEHCRRRHNRWMANLRRNYINSPWAIASLCAGFALLVLTFLQTIFTMIHS